MGKYEDMVERSMKIHLKTLESFKEVQKEVQGLKKDHVDLVKIITKRFKDHSASLTATRKVCTIAEETLTNVLLAIRQNEYLQAEYPEQHGYPQMKVVGIHPAKTNPNP